ncbi:MAG: translesion error-prone DNA polymerase V autoproteolytic subunit [Chloroflexi bacterium]|uniref:Translesion error-prone DNA polymerase V autoproteolytic subunit n=1 Tax=Candidatus Chlorohelix allophototropha TaxID=3003348 RepID=A0A8T7M3V9_9CHLR|nr:translesion error-prone DNA polymerase V autoproteolytic subunit [Chloroflexota bacterium]WJW69975.1 translesion error-prone DNA polymerase V autoproteolytic subunit [Chloroflexota bacterium L227-S17]
MRGTAAETFGARRLPEFAGLPLFLSAVAAGFPSPAEDYVDTLLDLNRLLIKNPAATFFMRVSGESMLGAGIHPHDVLVVDRSLKPRDGSVVVAVLDGEFTVKRLRKRQGGYVLEAENALFPPLVVTGEMTLEIWGVVTAVVHDL